VTASRAFTGKWKFNLYARDIEKKSRRTVLIVSDAQSRLDLGIDTVYFLYLQQNSGKEKHH